MTTAPFPIDTEGHIDRDDACLGCGYNLRGLKPSQSCPECGEPIHKAINQWFLRNCDPHWVRDLARGVAALLIALMLVVAAAVIDMGLGNDAGVIDHERLIDYAGVIAAVGCWMLTRPDPHRVYGDPARLSRLVARWGSLAALPAVSHLMSHRLTDTFDVLAILVGALGMGAIAMYGPFLARRVPSRAIACNWKIAAGGLATSTGFCGVFVASDVSGLDIVSAYIHPLVLGLVILASLLLFSLYWSVVALWFCLMLRRAAQQAKARAPRHRGIPLPPAAVRARQ